MRSLLGDPQVSWAASVEAALRSHLSIPETAGPRSIAVAVSFQYLVDDATAWLLGAKDYPASVTFYSHEDLPDPEEEEGF